MAWFAMVDFVDVAIPLLHAWEQAQLTKPRFLLSFPFVGLPFASRIPQTQSGKQ